MKKRILTVLLAVCLVVALGTVTAMADGDVTDVNELKTAVQTSGTIIIGNDMKFSKGDIVTIPQGVTIVLDMQGHSITVDSDFTGRPIINRGTLTVTGDGTIDSSASSADGLGSIDNYGTLTIEMVPSEDLLIQTPRISGIAQAAQCILTEVFLIPILRKLPLKMTL